MAVSIIQRGTTYPVVFGGFPFAPMIDAEITLGATGDYVGGTGLALTPAQFVNTLGTALKSIFRIIPLTVRTSGGVIRPLTLQYDFTNNSIRAYKSAAGVLAAVSTAAMAAGNGAGTETFVRSTPFVLPANTLSANGMAVRLTGSGLSTATADATKQVKVRLGGVAGFDVTAGVTQVALTTTVIVHWSMTATIIRTGAATQDAWYHMIVMKSDGTTPQTQAGFTTGGTQDFTTNLTMGMTVNATNANVMIGKTEMIELIGTSGVGGIDQEITAASDLAVGDVFSCLVIGV